MSVVLRCPSCSAKLRLDESPPIGTMIDCPKCDTTFPVRSTTSEEKTKPPEEASKPGKAVKPAKKNKVVETEDREFMNEFALLGIVGGVMFGLILSFGIIYFILNRAAKVEDLVATVPEGYPIVRGVNVEQMNKMPGYKEMTDTVYTKEMQEGYAHIAKSLGVNPAKLSYLVIARTGGVRAQSNELYLFRVKDSIDRSKADKIEGIRPNRDPSGRTYFAFDENHELPFLKGAVVECPSKNLVIVSRNDLYGKSASDAAALALNKPADGMQKKIGDVGKIAIKAHFWTVIRPMGQGKETIGNLAFLVAKDNKEFTKLAEAVTTTPVFAVWTTFGANGLRCASGIECSTDQQAKELVKSMQEGPLGKGDESDPPSGMRSSFAIVGMKKTWGEFIQSLEFNQSGKAAFFKVKVEGESRQFLFDYFTAPYGEKQPQTPPG